MPEGKKIYQLIVRQRSVANPELDALLQVLQVDFNLDTYTARQRLIGPGLALFGKGPLEKTSQVFTLLQRHGFACWLLEPQPPELKPDLLRSLEIHGEHISFTCQKGLVRLDRGAAVVGVLADLSGGLAEKHVKRLLAQNTYRGSDALEVFSRDEMIRATLQGQPVFDFYLLDQEGKVGQAVQVVPGRFNVDGLGSRAAMGTRQNLQALVQLVEEYAGSFRLHCDFGLSQLPGCEARRASESPSAVMENRVSLSRYGWLVARLKGDGRPLHEPQHSGEGQVSGALGVLVAGQPTLGAIFGENGGTDVPPVLSEVAQEVQRALEADGLSSSPLSSASHPERRDLPAPPDLPGNRPNWGNSFMKVSAVSAGFAVAVGGGNDLLRSAFDNGLATGVVPLIAAIPLLWGGFHFIRLKRRIENTPTSKVRSLAMGLVEIHGRAKRCYALVAPMTQSACVWYRLRKYRKDNNKSWKLVKEVNSNHVPFLVDDGTGRVNVDPAGATVKAKVQQAGYPGQSPLTFTAFGSSYAEDEKWIEDIIYEGTSIYVLGYAQPLRKERMGLRERTLTKLRQLKLDPKALHRYDTDGDGVIDEAEWQGARNDAEQEALREHLAESEARKRQEDSVVIGKGPQRSLPFVITETVSEADLVRKYGFLSLPLLVAGLMAMTLALYKLLQYLGL